ncbi:prospero homeobox protein 1-like isoform X2 [Protopterus annectens]|uniref:prospero homeobox protein 1-like isoform X2 n=1 Tax=Protopterus annectens TaxID=7888 RepID=UPI001CFB5F47|nr:prospero homeobox protein 1-like isoform X2 [Protopterus annectens]
MNVSTSEQDIDNLCQIYKDEKGDPRDPIQSCLKRNLLGNSSLPYSNGSIISHLLRKSITHDRMSDQNIPYFPASNLSSSNITEFGQESRNCALKEEVYKSPSSPLNHPTVTHLYEVERLYDEHLQAKRARVENIVRGMTNSPNSTPLICDVEKHGDYQNGHGKDSYRENKRKQRLPQHQTQPVTDKVVSERGRRREEECNRLKKQLQTLQRQLKCLQEKLFQVYDLSNLDQEHEGRDKMKSLSTSNNTETEEHFNISPDKRVNNVLAKKSLVEEETNKCSFTDKRGRDFSSSHDGHNLSEILKQELADAMTQIVDSVLKKFSSKVSSYFPQINSVDEASTSKSWASDDQEGKYFGDQEEETEDANKHEDNARHSHAENSVTGEQTEALPLVVKKSHANYSAINPLVKGAHQISQIPFHIALNPQVQDSQMLGHLLRYGQCSNLGAVGLASPLDRSSPESLDLPWENVNLRSKVTSNPNSHQKCASSFSHDQMETLCIPHVKTEYGDLQGIVEGGPYSSSNIQEGLTPNHLKKAKLMFFYSRYPSSSVLKTFFPDVKFNRCITSQLIKWFSNFREFYYIQMEKFARQAIMEGVTDPKKLTVTRDSELFRALNMHYNKANDFQVPVRFLEVAETTLREFFSSIITGKDTDPSWKKSIYKVIAKLDGEIPESFKFQTSLQDFVSL